MSVITVLSGRKMMELGHRIPKGDDQFTIDVKITSLEVISLVGSIVLPVWLGSTRTRPSQVSPLDSILPMQILTSSFH
ncbi:hypothetical protein TNCV_3223371 [Trichonephila clavipes]|nr:hypothetical protein TNCV_3223371 [Trichonephila clavipes]